MSKSNCKMCNTEFQRPGQHIGVFCSIDCKAQWQRTQKPVDKDWLIQKYVTEGLGTYQIGKIVERNPKQVYNWLKGYGIPIRKRRWKIEQTGKPYQRKDWLREEYHSKGRTASEIAADFDVTPNNIIYFLKKFGIPTRTTSETRAIKHWGASGENNPMYGVHGPDHPGWKGGITPERQAFYNSLEWTRVSRKVWKRDKRTCQRCSIKWKPEKSIPFHIHHIVSFAVRELRMDLSNLVLLCESCHYWIHSSSNIKKLWLQDYEI